MRMAPATKARMAVKKPTTMVARRGRREKLVMRSNCRRTSFQTLYLLSPRERSACATGISVMRPAKRSARTGMKVEISCEAHRVLTTAFR